MGDVEKGAQSVSIGGRPHTVARFKTYKAVLVGEVLSKVTRELRGLFAEAAEFRREYRATNPLQITRQVCIERITSLEGAVVSARDQSETAPDERPEGDDDTLTKRDWTDQIRVLEARAESWRRQLEDLGDRPFIEVPQDPSDEEVMMAVFPKAFAMRRELAELLALLVTPDSELAAEWHRDSVHDTLKATGEKLITDSEPAEIVELALVAKRVVGDQFRPLVPALRSIWESWTEEPAKDKQPETTSDTTSTDGSLTSSTSSPEPTDGDSTGSSSEPRSPSPLPLATG